MFGFLTAESNQIFTIALAVMVLIGFLEGLATLMGLGFSNLLDALIHDIDLDIPDAGHVHTAGILDAPSVLGKMLAWLQVGKVPVLMLVVVFLCAFGGAGLSIQAVVAGMSGTYLPTLIAAPAAFLVSLPLTRSAGRMLSYIIPKDETTAISEATFIGRSAVVTTGTAKRGAAAQAKLRDQHGQTHYIMVEPDEDQEDFPPGAQVLLVKKIGAVFVCITDSTGTVCREEGRGNV